MCLLPSISLPKCTFSPHAGQPFSGWALMASVYSQSSKSCRSYPQELTYLFRSLHSTTATVRLLHQLLQAAVCRSRSVSGIHPAAPTLTVPPHTLTVSQLPQGASSAVLLLLTYHRHTSVSELLSWRPHQTHHYNHVQQSRLPHAHLVWSLSSSMLVRATRLLLHHLWVSDQRKMRSQGNKGHDLHLCLSLQRAVNQTCNICCATR